MRLYLSSFRIGNRPDALLQLLAGRTRTALILNAADYQDAADRAASLQREREQLLGVGLTPVEIDLRDYFGRADALRQALTDFDLLYVRGGNVFILRRAFRQSGADVIVPELLARDAVVYGGYSAGVCLLGPTLDGLALVDDPELVPAGYTPAAPSDGLGILPFAVAPHYRSEHPETAAIERLVAYYLAHHIPFVALRDGEALVRDGERLTAVS